MLCLWSWTLLDTLLIKYLEHRAVGSLCINCVYYKYTYIGYTVDEANVQSNFRSAYEQVSKVCLFVSNGNSIQVKTQALPQSQWLWSPLPPPVVRLGSVAQACWWHRSQSACTARWGANWPAPLHPCQDSTAPLRRGRSLCPGWNSGGQVRGSQEQSGKRIQRTGQVESWFWRRKQQWTGSPSWNIFKELLCVTFVNSKFRLMFCPNGVISSPLQNGFERFAPGAKSQNQNLTSIWTDWQNDWVICPCYRVKLGCLISVRMQSLTVTSSWTWTAVRVAVPLWQQRGGERQALSCHIRFSRQLTFYRIILRSIETRA